MLLMGRGGRTMVGLVRNLGSRAAIRVREEVPTREPGQAMAEYAVILAGVSLVVIFAIWALGAKIWFVINLVARTLP